MKFLINFDSLENYILLKTSPENVFTSIYYILTQGAQENGKMLRAHIVNFFGTPYRTWKENFVQKFLDFIKS
jgi:hypothetical protein